MTHAISHIIERSIRLILDRFEREGASYPFVNTKFDIVSNRDFDETDEPFRRKECIYSWIQGRGLESLAKHIEYLEKRPSSSVQGDANASLSSRLRRMLETVAGKMEELRKVNSGRLPFAMRLDGSSFFEQAPSDANFSDLFYAKGLFAAGRVLGNETWLREGRELFLRVLEAIRNRRFRTDQQSFDPKNQVAFVPGKHPQGPRMIALGGIADFLQAYPEEPLWLDTASEFIRFILDNHVSQGGDAQLKRIDFIESHKTRPPLWGDSSSVFIANWLNRLAMKGAISQLQKYDFIESLDDDLMPWKDDNTLFCDPGHALEFTGLAGKCLLVLKRQGRGQALIDEAGRVLPQLFCHVFDYGFNWKAGGIVKGFDLVSRCPVNSDMPWWSLPETTRAGLELAALYPEVAGPLSQRAGMAFQAFTQGFLQDNGFGCQTRSAEGDIIQVIPAVSDADPGYHTNLSLMDAEELLEGDSLDS